MITPMSSNESAPHKASSLNFEKPVWVTPNEAIRISGIKRTLLYELIAKGTLKSIKLGGKRLISYASIESLGEWSIGQSAEAGSRSMARRRSGIAEDVYIFSETRAAKFLGISERKLEAMRRSFAGPSFRYVNSCIRYCLKDLLDFADEQHANGVAPQNVEDWTGMASAGSSEFRLLTPEDLENLPEPTWLVNRVIPKGAFCVLYGEPGCGKTFVALSLALSIAAGHPWCGKTTVPGSILYVAAEGLSGLKLRVQAYQQKHGLKAESIRYLGRSFDLRDADDVMQLLVAMEGGRLKPDLIILDTLARLTVGADENSARDIGQAIGGIDRLRLESRAAVLVIHHTRKNGGTERGSSALRGAADVMIEYSRSDPALVQLKCDKMKDAEPFKLGQLGLECIRLGASSSSLAVTSWKEALEAGVERASEKKALEILERQFGSTGARHKDWLAASGLPSKTFNRARGELLKSGAVRQDGPIYHPNRPDPGVSVSLVSP
jgi:AAA domain